MKFPFYLKKKKKEEDQQAHMGRKEFGPSHGANTSHGANMCIFLPITLSSNQDINRFLV